MEHLVDPPPTKFLGYWAPSPGTPPYGNRDLSYLPDPRDYIDPDWDPQEKARVLAYVEDGRRILAWMGYPACRLCDVDCFELGTCCLSDGTYVWPEGFSHYIKAHDVKPPQEFIDWALRDME